MRCPHCGALDIGRLVAEREAALEAVLLFHGPWDEQKQARWKAITGKDEATTQVLCDHIRKVLAPGAPGA